MTNIQLSNLQTFKLGLIGYPLGHSLSPKIHTTALQACGLEGNYSLFPIYPNDNQGLKELLTHVRAGEIHGLNVTIPHKQNVIPLLDELTPTAQGVGAVNTIFMRENKLIGDNTDAAGFLVDLKKFLTTEALSHGDLNALVLGAGGSARAVAYALANDGCRLTISARRMEQAQQLASSFPNYEIRIMDDSDIRLSTFRLLVNTTPLGMTPNTEESPLPDDITLPAGIMIYDLVYNPRETKLVKDARAQGAQATTGLGMLIEQAALAFELWTGMKPAKDILYASVVE